MGLSTMINTSSFPPFMPPLALIEEGELMNGEWNDTLASHVSKEYEHRLPDGDTVRHVQARSIINETQEVACSIYYHVTYNHADPFPVDWVVPMPGRMGLDR